MSAEEWEIVIGDDPETPAEAPVERLVVEGDDSITAIVNATGYGDAEGIEVHVGDHIIIVGANGGGPHIQIYGPAVTVVDERLTSGRKDLDRQRYLRVMRT